MGEPSVGVHDKWAAIHRHWPAVVLLFALLAAYAPTLSMPYLFMDDYKFVYERGAAARTTQFFTSIGRPLTAGYLLVCRQLLHQVGSHAACYFLGIIGLWCLAIASYLWMIRCSVQRIDAAILCFLIGVLPSTQVYVGWMTAGSSTFAAAIATVAIILFDRRRGADGTGETQPWLRASGAILLLIIAQMIYQPAALYFWSMALVGLLASETATFRDITRRALSYLAVGCTGIALYLIAYKLMLVVLGISAPDRAKPVGLQDVPGKMAWFFKDPLQNALSLFAHSPSRIIAAATLVIIVAGLLVRGKLIAKHQRTLTGASSSSSRWYVVAALLCVVAMIPLSYIFNLAVREQWGSFRSVFAMASVVVVLLFFGVHAIGSVLGPIGRVLPPRWALAACALFAALLCHQSLYRMMVFPQVVEFQFMQFQISRAGLNDQTPIHIIRPHWSQGVCTNVRYDEFNVPCSCQPWVPQQMAVRALRDLGMNPNRTISHGTETEAIPPGVTVIDMRQMAGLQLKTRR